MKALNTTTLLFVAVVLSLPANQNALAGQTSALDPYADIQPASKAKVKHTPAPKPEHVKPEHVKAAKAPKKSAAESAYGNERDLEPAPAKEESAPPAKAPKVVKAPKPEKAAKPEKTSEKPAPSEKPEKTSEATEKAESDKSAVKKSASKTVQPDGEGVGSGIREIGQGYVKTFKAAGGSFASGAKAVGAKFASGAKASGDYLSKTAGAVGDKVKSGADAVGDKVKTVKVAKSPKEPKEKASEEVAKAPKKSKQKASEEVAEKPAPKEKPVKEKPVKEVAAKPEKTKKPKAPKVAAKQSEQALDQATAAPQAGVPDFSTIGKPLPPVEPMARTHRVKIGPGVIGKTVGKFNPFGSKKTKTAKAPEIKVQPARQAAVDIMHPQTN
jgi:DNA-binding protein HU-beta